MQIDFLKQYLKTVLDLEKQKFETEQLIDKVRQNHYEAKIEDLEKEAVADNSKQGNYGCAFSVIGVVIGGIIGFFLAGVTVDSSDLGLLFLLAGPVLGWVIGMQFGKPFDDSNSHKKAEYQNVAIRSKNAVIQQNNRKVELEAQQKNALIASSVKQLQNSFENTNKLLMKIYESDVIYPKYRNLVAISSIYEYIDSGRCNSLDGADGAYNIYEVEVRLDKIVTNLDKVIVQLNQIKENQYYLYSALQEIKPAVESLADAIKENTDKLDSLHAETTKTAVNTEVLAYVAKTIEKNQYYERNWNNMRGLVDRSGL